MNTKPFQILVGKSRITGVVQLFNVKSLSVVVTENNAKGASAEAVHERAMLRHLVSLEVDGDAAGALDRAQEKCSGLAAHVLNLITEQAGYPWTAPAMKAGDELTPETPPMVLAAAGLTREKADDLLAGYPKAQRLIRITDKTRKTIFACVLRTPESEETAILKSAQSAGKGLPDAILSLTRACVTWSRDPLEGAISTYPAIPLLSLVEDFEQMGVVSAEARFL